MCIRQVVCFTFLPLIRNPHGNKAQIEVGGSQWCSGSGAITSLRVGAEGGYYVRVKGFEFVSVLQAQALY